MEIWPKYLQLTRTLIVLVSAKINETLKNKIISSNMKQVKLKITVETIAGK